MNTIRRKWLAERSCPSERNLLRCGGRGALAFALVLAGGCSHVVEFVAKQQSTSILNPNSVQGSRDHNADFTLKDPYKPLDDAADRLRGGRRTGAAAQVPQPTRQEVCNGREYSFFCKQVTAEEAPADDAAARDYLETGITLSNELCNAWFERLGVAQVTLHQTSDSISAVGSLTTAIMSFAQSDTKAIGLAASTFGFGKQLTDSVTANYIVSVDLTSTAAAVRQYRALYAQNIETAQARWTYNTARRVVMAYDNTCSALYVRQFVNERVSGTKTDGVQQLTTAAINSFLGEYKKYFDVQPTLSQLVDVYAFLYLDDATADIKAKLLSGLPAGLKTADGVKFAENANLDSLHRDLIYANIDATLKAKAEARVEAMKSALASAAVAKADSAMAANDDAAHAAGVAGAAQAASDAKANEVKAAQAKLASLKSPPAAGAPPPADAAALNRAVAETEATLAQKNGEATALQANAQSTAAAAEEKRNQALQAQKAADDLQSKAIEAGALATSSGGMKTAGTGVPVDANNRPLDIPPPP